MSVALGDERYPNRRNRLAGSVYIKQLDGLTMPNGEVHNGICIAADVGGMDEKHFDLCVGREDHHISIPSVGSPGTICEIEILDVSNVSKPGGK